MAAIIESPTSSSINTSIQVHVPETADIHKNPPRLQSCKITYRFRKVSSKGALLVLLWVFLVNAGFGPSNIDQRILVSLRKEKVNVQVAFQYVDYVLATIAWITAAIVSVRIAESKAGNYKTVRFGLLTSFIATILSCIVTLILDFIEKGDFIDKYDFQLAATISRIIPECLKSVGNAIVILNSLQLGLDQMPDASSANITSYIAWFVFSAIAGVGIYEITYFVPQTCLSANEKYYQPVQYLLPVVYLSIVLCTDFLLSPNWLAKPLGSSQFFTTIYQVLKFATKHKAPINRSAFTYWEEDIPSRIDLGKSRYGGPFTTEQVENVKTVLSMLKIGIPISLMAVSLYLSKISQKYFETASNVTFHYYLLSNCSRVAIEQTITKNTWWILLIIVVYEFAIYPLVVNWVPTSLKRIGIGSALILTVSCICLVLYGVCFWQGNQIAADILWIDLPHSVVTALIIALLYTAILEFICAQSPHNIQGFMICYVWCMYAISSILVAIIISMLKVLCKEQGYCAIIFSSIITVISSLSCFIFCFMSNRYKQRVREETTTPHIWAEEAYGKYLLSHSRN